MNTSIGKIRTISSNTIEGQWLVPCNRPIAPTCRLVFFPWAGAGVTPLKRVLQDLPPSVDAMGVLLPGRETRSREAAQTNPDKIVSAIAHELAQLAPLPLTIAGHSLGGRLAVELAHYLTNVLRMSVNRTIVSAARAPGSASVAPYTRCSGDVPEDTLLNDIRTVGGTPEVIFTDKDLRRMIVRIVRADYQLLDQLAARSCPTLDCPLDVFGASDDVTTCIGSLQGWRRFTTESSFVRMFDGDHFYLGNNKQEFIERLSATLLND